MRSSKFAESHLLPQQDFTDGLWQATDFLKFLTPFATIKGVVIRF
ncbi:hypothetical protein BRO54_0913 [Geobacillus proteiniphilus]|uniref:Uncharacterized protein n=1 Tax=Geobacillus proteiniphilus TaxID=860353 RepID=A0A1Q5T5K4_9BACL|nr:hypothetical protein BRO54_0913 [Geobacillus proteiniphilus]